MVLVDTTVWVDLFLGRETPFVSQLQTLISDGEDLCTCGLIMTEVLQGISNDAEYRKTLTVLSELLYLPMERSMFIDASKIYRDLRKKGITIRKTIDCMIASICLKHGVQLLHNDRDFTFIADVLPLQVCEVQC